MNENEIIKKISDAWIEILTLDSVNNDDLFIQSGGDSRKSLKLEIKIYEMFGIEISLFKFFKDMSITSLAGMVQNKIESNYIGSKINKAPISIYYPATDSQKAMYKQDQSKLQDNDLIMHYELRMKGAVNVEQYRNIYCTLLKQHSAFRTVFKSIDGEVVQCVGEDVNGYFRYVESNNIDVLSAMTPFYQRFNLNEDTLFRMGLIKVDDDDEHILVLVFHHIIFDGISLDILLDEISNLLVGKKLNCSSVDYTDYAYWLNNKRYDKKSEEHWKDRLAGVHPELNLPMDYTKSKEPEYSKGTSEIELSPALFEKLTRTCKYCNITSNTLLFSIFYILIYRYTGEDDIVISTLSSGRNHAALSRVIGMFINKVAVRTYIDIESTFLEFCKYVEKSMMLDFEHGDYSFQMILDYVLKDLPVGRKLAINPLSDTLFAFHDYSNKRTHLGSSKITSFTHNEKEINYLDLYMEVFSHNDGITLRLVFNTKLFDKKNIEKMINRYQLILEEITDNPVVQLKNITIATKVEISDIHEKFNNTDTKFNKDLIVTECLERWAGKSPNQIAVSDGNSSMTYGEFNRKTNQLASYLRKIGIKSNDIVGIIAERTLEMILIVFSIVKSGAAYMPISPSDPLERKKYILADSGAMTLILTDEKYMMPDCTGVSQINYSELDLLSENDLDLQKINTEDDIVYVIYTSGSTGNPKGVMITHSGLMNNLEWMNSKYNFGVQDCIMQKTTYTFDVSVWEMFLWCVTGANVHLPKIGVEKDPEKLIQEVYTYNISYIHFVPSMFEIFLDSAMTNNTGNLLGSLKNVFCSGEALKIEQVNKFNQLFNDNALIKLHNLYGPTEATIHATCFECSKGKCTVVPIGKPIDNIKMYILDHQLNIQPIGFAGELCISGVGLAKGYLNNEKLTNDKFIDSPFKANEKLYKTGDLAKWLDDGNIQYLGRMDNQVKLRGYRIELGEIESKIREMPFIDDCLVVLRNDLSEEPYLCAYYISDEDIIKATFNNHLAAMLPDYMVPRIFVKIDCIPLTCNGKVNIKALPEPLLEDGKYKEVMGNVESRLVEIWKTILGIGTVDNEDNFFEMGGQSIKAMKLAAVIKEEFKVCISFADIFRELTITKLAEFISNCDLTSIKVPMRVDDSNHQQISFFQEMMYFSELNNYGTADNVITVVFSISKSINTIEVEECFRKLVERHELLRTSFDIVNDNIVRLISQKADLEIHKISIEKSHIDDAIQNTITGFDLGKAPLLRVTIADPESEYAMIIVNIHHIISDYRSIQIFLKELSELIAHKELCELKSNFSDYAVYENNVLANPDIKEVHKYWIEKLMNYSNPHKQACEYVRKIEKLKLSKANVSLLKDFGNRYNCSVYMVIFAAFSISISKLYNQEDLVIGIPVSLRDNDEFQDILGPIVNTVAVRIKPQSSKKLSVYLQEVWKTMLEAYRNKHYPFTRLIKDLNLSGQVDRNPLFNVLFVMYDEKLRLLNDGIELDAKLYTNDLTNMDIVAEMTESLNEISISFKYNEKITTKISITELTGNIVNVLNCFIAMSEEFDPLICDIDSFELGLITHCGS